MSQYLTGDEAHFMPCVGGDSAGHFIRRIPIVSEPKEAIPEYIRACSGPDCIAWRYKNSSYDPPDDRYIELGYCGLAGNPNGN